MQPAIRWLHFCVNAALPENKWKLARVRIHRDRYNVKQLPYHTWTKSWSSNAVLHIWRFFYNFCFQVSAKTGNKGEHLIRLIFIIILCYFQYQTHIKTCSDGIWLPSFIFNRVTRCTIWNFFIVIWRYSSYLQYNLATVFTCTCLSSIVVVITEKPKLVLELEYS